MIKSIIATTLILFSFVSKNLDGLSQAEKNTAIYLGKLDGQVILEKGDIEIWMYDGRSSDNESKYLSGINDKDLDVMSNLKNRVNKLSLETDKITNIGFRKLGIYKNLVRLSIISHNFDDSCKDIFSDYSKLDDLTISDTSISGITLKEIGKLKTITRLDLGGSTIKDDDLKYLGDLPKLKNLILSQTKITDKGLKILSELKFNNLRYLWLNETNISDEGAQSLLKIKSLSNITMVKTKVTVKMVQRLQKELYSPGKIDFDIRIRPHSD
jgi:hypothetical protein